jgi:protein-L-isoaspartate(D-aspartate) O-methyltransferase
MVTKYIFIFLTIFLFSGMSCSAEKSKDYTLDRERMVTEQIIARGISDQRVISAMLKVPRHLFVPENQRSLAYEDYPLPIGDGQTISQPYIVAYMTECLNLTSNDRVLEIGTGSGYQAAILAQIAHEVYTIEYIKSLGTRAQELFKQMNYSNIHVKIGDGYKGWPKYAPFNAIIVTCAPEKIPEPLIQQLSEGGRIIVPVGKEFSVQELVRGVKVKGKLETKTTLPVRFVPMIQGKE